MGTETQSLPNTAEHRRQSDPDGVSADPKHAIPRTLKLLIASRVSARATRVIAAINFNDEPRSRREKIHDEVEHRYLAPKLNTELPRAERVP
jgi:hypothetical protein